MHRKPWQLKSQSPWVLCAPGTWGNDIGRKGLCELLTLGLKGSVSHRFDPLVYTKYFTYIISFNYDNNPVRYYSSQTTDEDTLLV